jgi:hypothetical protein
MSESGAPRLIALYLPQFHPIAENDRFWGLGFTEWTNVAAARPLYRGHEQPKLPGELGFYDLRLAETRSAHAAFARGAGIEGFCYWHYWFGGHRILERPFQEVLESGEPDFPFCLCWANGDWNGVWYGTPGRILVEQTYPGAADYRGHFEAILPALRDRRYLRVGECPMSAVFHPMALPDPKEFCALWCELAERAGLPGLHLVGFGTRRWDPTQWGFDASVQHSPRIPRRFRHHLRRELERVARRRPEQRIVFVKSWNEWAEGNYLEPDCRFGRAYLDVVREERERAAQRVSIGHSHA